MNKIKVKRSAIFILLSVLIIFPLMGCFKNETPEKITITLKAHIDKSTLITDYTILMWVISDEPLPETTNIKLIFRYRSEGSHSINDNNSVNAVELEIPRGHQYAQFMYNFADYYFISEVTDVFNLKFYDTDSPILKMEFDHPNYYPDYII